MAGRFSLSFPGRRDEDDPWFNIGGLAVTTSVLVPLLCVMSMFVWAVSPSLLVPFVLYPGDIAGGQVWRLVTWPLANGPDFWTVLLLAMLWYFGRELERMVGRRRYATLMVLLAVVPGIVASIAGVEMAGIRPVEIAVFCIFCAQFPDVRFWGAVPAWVFALVIVGIEALLLVGSRQGGGLLVLIASLATAALVSRRYGLLAAYAWIPQFGSPSGDGRPRRRQKRSSSKRSGGQSVVQGPWEQPSQGLSAAEQLELDGLLDKTSAGGLDSLSRAEKARLNELSKKLRSR
ncbi:MAG: hypothetical protein RJB61_277 [Actinomycetota bacterium]|jgi:membrane associated rhomboid family serine protease